MDSCPACGRPYIEKLTATEYHVAGMVAQGIGPTEIARHTGISLHGVKMHLQRIYRKLGIVAGQPHVKLAVYWNCELFQIGLRAQEDPAAIAA